MACLEFVELASAEWNVLLCREAEDDIGMRCGDNGFSRFVNGTALSAGAAKGGATVAEFHLERYLNFMVENVASARAARVPVVRRLLETLRASGRLQQPLAAEAVRAAVEAAWPETPTTWNVVVEAAGAGAHYYFSEEQFNFDLRGIGVREPPGGLLCPGHGALHDHE